MEKVSGLEPFLAVGVMEAIECCTRFCIPVFVMILRLKCKLVFLDNCTSWVTYNTVQGTLTR